MSTEKLEFEENGDVIELNGEVVFTVADLESYVDNEYATNLWENVYIDNNSPKHDGDPSYDLEDYRQTQTAAEYMEDESNFQHCCNDYFKHLKLGENKNK